MCRKVKRREQVSNTVAVFVESRVENEERDVERVEQESTGSSVVSVASLVRIVRTRSGIVVIEEEVKIFKGR